MGTNVLILPVNKRLSALPPVWDRPVNGFKSHRHRHGNPLFVRGFFRVYYTNDPAHANGPRDGAHRHRPGGTVPPLGGLQHRGSQVMPS